MSGVVPVVITERIFGIVRRNDTKQIYTQTVDRYGGRNAKGM